MTTANPAHSRADLPGPRALELGRATETACRPFRPHATVYATGCPSASAAKPSRALTCTNASCPSSPWRNPYPFSMLYHLTMPRRWLGSGAFGVAAALWSRAGAGAIGAGDSTSGGELAGGGGSEAVVICAAGSGGGWTGVAGAVVLVGADAVRLPRLALAAVTLTELALVGLGGVATGAAAARVGFGGVATGTAAAHGG